MSELAYLAWYRECNLQERIELALDPLSLACRFFPRNGGIDRLATEPGIRRTGAKAVVISLRLVRKHVAPGDLSTLMIPLQNHLCHINLLTPTHIVLQILQARLSSDRSMIEDSPCIQLTVVEMSAETLKPLDGRGFIHAGSKYRPNTFFHGRDYREGAIMNAREIQFKPHVRNSIVPFAEQYCSFCR